MGKTTGWTSGNVTRSCVNHAWNGTSWLVCQVVTDYVSDRGDSGGLVFVPYASTYMMPVGIHNGKYPENLAQRVFSPWRFVDFEIGAEVGILSIGEYP